MKKSAAYHFQFGVWLNLVQRRSVADNPSADCIGMVNPAAKGRFRGAYSVGNALDGRDHDLTPERDAIEEVVADLLEAQKQRGTLHFAQIIDAMTLRPTEPARETLARLREPEAGGDGAALAKRRAARPKSGDHESSTTSRSFGVLLLAMAVICVATVACVLMLP